MRKILIALAFTSLSSTLIINSADAQYNYVPTLPEKKNVARPEPRAVQGKEINLPNMPKFPGAKFISGSENKNKGGQVVGYTVQYNIPKSSESQVIPYYANSLSGGGWKVTQQGEDTVNASNSKSYSNCSVSIGSYDDFYSSINVTYWTVDPELMPQ